MKGLDCCSLVFRLMINQGDRFQGRKDLLRQVVLMLCKIRLASRMVSFEIN